jgi:hypothetical protein
VEARVTREKKRPEKRRGQRKEGLRERFPRDKVGILLTLNGRHMYICYVVEQALGYATTHSP